jgi:hypothetical protein
MVEAIHAHLETYLVPNVVGRLADAEFMAHSVNIPRSGPEFGT